MLRAGSVDGVGDSKMGEVMDELLIVIFVKPAV